jgi:hypothetical protein
MVEGGCQEVGVAECPCEDSQDDFCKVAAAVELAPTVRFAIVADTEPLLQALRDELRPDLPEVDGILGVDALRPLQLELDYPNERMLLRCIDREVCVARPQLPSRGDISEVSQCL